MHYKSEDAGAQTDDGIVMLQAVHEPSYEPIYVQVGPQNKDQLISLLGFIVGGRG